MPSNLYLPKDSTRLLRTPIAGLYATPAAPLPFLKGVVVRSFVLERAEGNIILYHAPGITAAASDILSLGHPAKLLVNHWHEGMYDAPDFEVPIFVHEADRARTELPISGTFSVREKIGNDIEVIPTPGHTAGTTMFLWDNGEHRLLFPGDSIWVQGGEWKAVLLAESDRASYLESLAVISSLKFDYLVPWGAEEDAPFALGVTHEEAEERIGRIVERLRRGKNA